jgi:hypothetical protein
VRLGAPGPRLVDGRSALEQIETDGPQMFTDDWQTWSEDVADAPAISSPEKPIGREAALPTLP